MKTICIPVDSRANYPRAASIIAAIDQHPELRCQFITLSKFSYEWQSFTTRYPNNVLQTYEPVDDSPMGMAKHSARIIESLTEAFRGNKPDVVIAMTDRYETLAVATTAALMNIRVAHVQGGELTGTIDGSLRHAITKLSHIHFPATNEALVNIIRMGEDPKYIYKVGCPATDLLLGVDVSRRPTEEPYILVLFHPVTTEHQESYKQMMTVLDGVKESWGGLIVVIGPNHDAGSSGIWQAIKDSGVHAPHLVPHTEFIKLMAHAKVMVGNSSAGIREACYFGTPVVDIGTRQQGRMPRAESVQHADGKVGIANFIRISLAKPRHPVEQLYGDGTAGIKIANILAKFELPDIQKRWYASSR